ncbi:MAG: hypothetical protein JRN37_04605 [Nitrososphaerota archaeon]|nr:hypothetical protein [Nitrososphaerota archaeon]MDG7042706.1 hypothetical protein [Nitrososphaerota archaeon]MDG7046105.1 hypothetical protein [Nitrososphaerota archaeon]MDG7047384.1 hypothetical protein [Nitrososphaerota archaeon]
MFNLNWILNPSEGLSLGAIFLISYILGVMHGATPDEHTWPITFSYAIGSYSTKKGMKAGLFFSSGFTAQRALLTTLGFIGLAAFYQKYNLDGPVYIIVGIAMFVAGSYILKGKYLHIPIDRLLGGTSHHTDSSERLQPHKDIREVPLKMATLHGLIAGFGFGAYATIITFILAPQVPSLIYAPLPGLFFGLGTMSMQIVFGALFANIARVKKLSENDIKFVGRSTAGRTLYYGGLSFALVGLLIAAVPILDTLSISTGSPIPNLNLVNVGFLLTVGVVGGIGLYSVIRAFKDISKMKASQPLSSDQLGVR